MRNLVLFMMLLSLAVVSCQEDDFNDYTPVTPGPAYPSATFMGTVTDSVTGQPIENVVVWREDPYEGDFEAYCTTTALGNFYFKMTILPEDSIKGKLFYFSKGNYNLKTIKILPREMDSIYDVRLIPTEADTVAPRVLLMETFSDYQYNMYKKHVRFIFTEEVIFNELYISDLAEVVFRRKADICSSYSNEYVFELQDAGYIITAISVRFSHYYQECDSCWSGYASYYSTKCETWELESVRLLPWLCTDLAGNAMIKYEYLSK